MLLRLCILGLWKAAMWELCIGLGRDCHRRIRIEGWVVCVHPCDLAEELTPCCDESHVFIRPISTDSSGVQSK